jgi:hypothetical protein
MDINAVHTQGLPLDSLLVIKYEKGRTFYHEKWQAPEIHLDDGRILVLEST